MSVTYEDEEDAAYRESPEYHDVFIKCRFCGDLFPEDAILAENVCEECANERMLAVCDNCGKLKNESDVSRYPEIMDGGRLRYWVYCHACNKEMEEG